MTRLLALDVSLNATGIVYPDGRIDCLRPPKTLRGGDRLLWWSTTWAVTLEDARPDRIVIEQPFAGKIRGDSTAKLQHAYGVLLAEIARHCPTTVVTWVPPATLKKAATGKGNASKTEMIAEANRQCRWNTNDIITDDNEADAWLLWTLCLSGEFDK
jgi:Holliday junction resolvasome RuvABC endonuclease subunit